MFGSPAADTKMRCTNCKCSWQGVEADCIKRDTKGLLRCPKCKVMKIGVLRGQKTKTVMPYGHPVVRAEL